MAMRMTNLLKGGLCLALGVMWGVAGAGGMMDKESMGSDEKMMEQTDKSMPMSGSDTLKGEGGMGTQEGDMKAMEAEMPMKEQEGMEKKGGM